MQHGKIQSGQAVTTYGVGSICDLSTRGGVNSGIIAGLDFWPTEKANEVYEPSLAKSLGVKKLFSPPIGEDLASKKSLPAYRFPRRLFCNRCYRIGFPGLHFDVDGGKIPRCKKNNCAGIGVPPRLIVVCFDIDSANPGPVRGCIDDFPWEWWLFGAKRNWCSESPELFMVQSKTSFTLAGLRVECRCSKCKGEVWKSLDGVFGERALAGRTCRGQRPWLNDEIECGKNVRVLLRGASNVYFPINFSTISIPPYSDALLCEIQTTCQMILTSSVSMCEKIKTVKEWVPMAIEYSDTDIENTIQTILEEDTRTVAVAGSKEQRNNERNALIRGFDGDRKGISNFVAKPASNTEMKHHSLLSNNFASLVHVTRLREVKALRGFLRLENPFGSDPLRQECVEISYGVTEWLPAVETKGEGFYLELNPEKLNSWAEKDQVDERFSLIKNNVIRTLQEKGHPLTEDKLPSLEFLLIHTLSHLIIRQISLECGYSASSIRERIYVNIAGERIADGTSFHSGVLIYTSTSDSDGTLGGLVRQSQPDRLEKIIKSAIEGARFCSSDPLCIESEGQGADSINLAACHGCLLLPETSCENNNRLLDRALIVGTHQNPQIGFFDVM